MPVGFTPPSREKSKLRAKLEYLTPDRARGGIEDLSERARIPL